MNETEQATEVIAKPELAATTQPVGDAAANRTFAAAPVLMDITLQVQVRMGRAQLNLGSVAQLGSGSVVELNCSVNDPVEIVVNDRVIAEGEIVIVDGNYGVRVTRLAGSAMPEMNLGTEHALRNLSDKLR